MINSLVLLVPRRSLSKCLTIPFIASALLVGSSATPAQQDSSRPPGPGWVVIGLDEYKTLRAKAYPPEREPEPPPVEATLSRVEYDLHVNGEVASGRATGVLPLSVNFPAFGPSVYLVAELTSENQSPSAELTYQQGKKGGAR
jgi:hypothetical protein